MNNIDEKNEVLSILKMFDDFCKKNNIRYILGYGTLLGAVRHKGFIPWDDDIDVLLITDEYNKLKKIARDNRFIDDKHRYSFALPGDKNYCYSFIKVFDNKYMIQEKNIAEKHNICLFIDVFRIDYWPESAIKESFLLKYAKLLLNLNKICIRGGITENKLKIIDRCLYPIDCLFYWFGVNTELLVSNLEKIGMTNKRSMFMGNLMSGSGRKSERLPSHIFKESSLAEFEGFIFPVPKDYDLYLRSIYGDYMKIPKKEEQISHGYNIVKIDQNF